MKKNGPLFIVPLFHYHIVDHEMISRVIFYWQNRDIHAVMDVFIETWQRTKAFEYHIILNGTTKH